MSIFYENPALKNFWYSVASELEIVSKPVGRTLLGVNIVVYRDPDGKVVAAPDRCPHREALLSKTAYSAGVTMVGNSVPKVNVLEFLPLIPNSLSLATQIYRPYRQLRVTVLFGCASARIHLRS